jgi:calcineurin-like phosphoesterase family protein
MVRGTEAQILIGSVKALSEDTPTLLSTAGTMIYFTADTHFGHKNIIKYCGRGAFNRDPAFHNGKERLFNDVEEMNEYLVYNWNLIVGPEDEIWHIGDVAFMNKEKTLAICNRLNGHKRLVMGNHDLKWKPEFWKEAGFEEVYKLGYGNVVHIPPINSLHPGFDLCHYPYREDLTSYDERVYLHEHAPPARLGTDIPVLLHGHVHTRWKTRFGQINVGVDVWNYKPVCIEKLRSINT